MGEETGTIAVEPLNRRNQLGEHHCFGCGTLNPHGLHLEIFGNETEVWADFTGGREHEGYAGLLHGGIVAALLDEVLGWSFFGRGVWAVTTRLALTYRGPVPIGTPVRVTARLARDRGRLLEATGEISDATGRVLVEAVGQFARVPEARRAAWERRYAAPAGETGE